MNLNLTIKNESLYSYQTPHPRKTNFRDQPTQQQVKSEPYWEHTLYSTSSKLLQWLCIKSAICPSLILSEPVSSGWALTISLFLSWKLSFSESVFVSDDLIVGLCSVRTSLHGVLCDHIGNWRFIVVLIGHSAKQSEKSDTGDIWCDVIWICCTLFRRSLQEDIHSFALGSHSNWQTRYSDCHFWKVTIPPSARPLQSNPTRQKAVLSLKLFVLILSLSLSLCMHQFPLQTHIMVPYHNLRVVPLKKLFILPFPRFSSSLFPSGLWQTVFLGSCVSLLIFFSLDPVLDHPVPLS